MKDHVTEVKVYWWLLHPHKWVRRNTTYFNCHKQLLLKL